jgi:hypothetical protein
VPSERGMSVVWTDRTPMTDAPGRPDGAGAEREALFEALADAEHASWAHWMDWVFTICPTNPDGSVTIGPDLVERWKRQAATPAYRAASAPAGVRMAEYPAMRTRRSGGGGRAWGVGLPVVRGAVRAVRPVQRSSNRLPGGARGRLRGGLPGRGGRGQPRARTPRTRVPDPAAGATPLHVPPPGLPVLDRARRGLPGVPAPARRAQGHQAGRGHRDRAHRAGERAHARC